MITKIKNAVFITDIFEQNKYLYIEDGKILEFSDREICCDNEIDAEGLYVSPGFIDIHTHGAGNRDFMDGTVEDVLEGAYAHAQHGTTTIFPTGTTSSTESILKYIENVRDAIKENRPGRPYIAGAHLEGPYFSDAQRGAQNPDYIKSPVPGEYREFVRVSEGTLKRISFAPELPGADALCEYLTENGIIAAFGHTDGVYSEIKPLIDKGCCLATHLYSGMNCVTRRNLLRNLGAVETSFLEDSVTVETICDGIHLPPELLRLIYKIKGADKICLVTDSMRAAGMPEGQLYALGPKVDNVECIVKNGIAYLPDMTAFAGSVATTDRLVRVMYKKVGVALPECIKMMCETPAKTMKLENRGKLKEGYFADLVFFDDDINVKKVIIEGKELE